MHITEYFVILYSELQEIINKFKIAYLHHQSMLNLENNAAKEAGNDVGNEVRNDAASNDAASNESSKEAGSNDSARNEDSKESAKEAGKEAAKDADEEEINLKEIYRKLLFIFHPDKSISPNEQIFGEIKKAWDDKYEPTILFYFIKNCHHSMLKIIHDKLHNTKGFLKTMKNLCNIITKEINDIRRTPIWKKYYNYNLRKI